MSRSKQFFNAVAPPFTIRDSRFGLRQLPVSENEVPDIFSYSSPGKGPNGEHQN